MSHRWRVAVVVAVGLAVASAVAVRTAAADEAALADVAPMTLLEAPTHLRFSAREVGAAARRQPAPVEAALRDCDADARCERVRAIWSRLLPIARAQPCSAGDELRLVLVTTGSSAYAHADGRVIFPLALIDALTLSDEEIAFILAHEIVHVLLEHERELLTAVDVLLRPDVRRSAYDVYQAMQFDLGLTLKASFLLHAAEHEADVYGLQLAALAGFAPQRQASALDKLLGTTGAGNARARGTERAVLATHPADVERVQRVRDVLPIAQALYQAPR